MSISAPPPGTPAPPKTPEGWFYVYDGGLYILVRKSK